MGLSLGEAAKVAHVSKTAIKNWIDSGKLIARKSDNGTYEINLEELQKVIEKRFSAKIERNHKAKTLPPETSKTKGIVSVLEVSLRAQIEVLKAEKILLQEALNKSEVLNDRLMNQIADLNEKCCENFNHTLLLHAEAINGLTQNEKRFLSKERTNAVYVPSEPTLATNSPEERKPLNFAAWQQVRRRYGSLYYTPEAQTQMKKDAQALGEEFYDLDESKLNPWD